ncbi:MAG: stage II sporulation protein M [Candidatus Micrarchaeota archaeon]
MVLEHLFSSKRIEHSPWLVALMAFMFVTIAVSLINLFIYSPDPNQNTTTNGLFIITLVVMPAIPFFLHEIILEERKQECRTRGNILECYNRLIKFYGYFFIGTVLGFAFCAALLPEDVSDRMFSVQKDEINLFTSINPQITLLGGGFDSIFFHNLEVLFLMLMFSFIYSIGSIFLLVWNASLVGLFLEQYIRSSIVSYSQYGILGFPTAFIVGSLNGLLRLLPHGIFEISAFFIASIAGGILSISIERRMYRPSNFRNIFLDATKLLVLSITLLAIGAFIESSYI